MNMYVSERLKECVHSAVYIFYYQRNYSAKSEFFFTFRPMYSKQVFDSLTPFGLISVFL